PMLFFPGWNTLLAGYLAGSGQLRLLSDLGNGDFEWYLLKGHVILAMFSFMLAMGGSFILNQMKDVESDQKNRKLFLIGNGYLGAKAAARESIFLLAGGLLTAGFINVSFLLVTAFFILISSYLYNFRPFLYKNRPFAGFTLNVLGGWLAFTLGWITVNSFTMQFIFHSLPYLFLNTCLILLTLIPDAVGDVATGKKTICVRYGLRRTVFVGAGLYILSLASSLWINDQLALLINLFLLFHFFRMIRQPSGEQAVRFLKMAIFYFSLAVCLKFPLYFILMVSVYFITRYYYRERFEFDYPNFRGA
ncbi:MAG: hypothetical protein EH225_00335, partial [Calditrichaeota bacterium]